jgi:hypothetical protein
LLGCGHGLGARPVGFDHQHIAIGQHQQLPRVLQVAGNSFDLQSGCDLWQLALLPANPVGNLHRRHQEVLCRG